MFLDKLAILTIDDVVTDAVAVPEWGTDAEVRVRSLSGDQRSRLYARAAAEDSGQPVVSNWKSLACAMGMINEKGELLFSEADAPSIGRKHPVIVSRIADKILTLSAMTAEAREELAKKRTPTTNSSGVSSPELSTPGTDSISTLSSETLPAMSTSDGKPIGEPSPGATNG